MEFIKKFSLYGAAALFIYMPFHVFLAQWLSTFTGGLGAWKIGKDVFTAFLTLLCIGLILTLKKQNKFYLIFLGLTAAYGLLHLVLIFITNQELDVGLLATAYNLRLFCYLIIGYSLALIFPKVVSDRKIIKWLIVISTIVCLVGLLQWFLPKDILTHFGYGLDRGTKPLFYIDNKPDLKRVMSTIREPNSLAAFLILPITILTYGLVRFWKTNKRILVSGLLLLHFLILFLTFSRSAFVATLGSIGLVLAIANLNLIKKITKKQTIAGLFVLVVLGVSVYALRDQYFIQNALFHEDENSLQTASNEEHFSKYDIAIEGIIEKPLGHGPGTAGAVSVHDNEGGLITENYYLQIAYEVGVVGLTLFLTMVYLVAKKLWELRNNTLAVCFLASLVGLSLINLLLHTWSNEAVTCQWWLLTGFLLIRNKNFKL